MDCTIIVNVISIYGIKNILLGITEYNNIHSVWIGHISDIEYGGIWDDWFIDRTEPLNLCIRLCENLIEQIVRNEKFETKR